MSKDAEKARLADTKILLTNDADLAVRDIVDIYSLRWQVELFFKELKSSLGFTRYRFKRFAAVEAWASLAITTFLYLEWYRAKQLRSSRLAAEAKRWWIPQRTHGLCQAIRLATERAEMDFLAKRLQTPGGINRLKDLLKRGFAHEYRAAM